MGGPVAGSLRWPRICSITFFSVMNAVTTRRPPHGQASTSSRNTRKSSSLQGMVEGRRSAFASPDVVVSARGAGPQVGAGVAGFGITSLRHFEAGPKTPWYRARCARVGGTSVAKRRISSPGSSTKASWPSASGRFSR